MSLKVGNWFVTRGMWKDKAVVCWEIGTTSVCKSLKCVNSLADIGPQVFDPTLIPDTWWESNMKWAYEGTEDCLVCRLEGSVGGLGVGLLFLPSWRWVSWFCWQVCCTVQVLTEISISVLQYREGCDQVAVRGYRICIHLNLHKLRQVCLMLLKAFFKTICLALS